jgi:hypothetical protein
MPVYQMTGLDGNTYQIEGPEGLTAGQVQAEIIKRAPQAGKSAPPTEYAGFSGSMMEAATTLGAADEAAAFAANPTDENRQALLKAAESKYKSASFGLSPTEDLSVLGRNWEALKEMAGGSLGFLAAPIAAGAVTGGIGGYGTVAAQYGVQNIARQAQEQQAAIEAGRAPEELSLGKAAAAAAGQTALDVVGGKVFGPLLSRFPLLKNLAVGGKPAEDSLKVLADAVKKGTLERVSGGAVVKGIGKGVAFEAPQEMAQQALEMWQAGIPVDQWRDELIQAGVGGAILGGPLGGVEAKYAAPRQQLQERQKRAFDLLVDKYTKQGLSKEQAAAQAREDIQTGNIDFEAMKLLGYSPTSDYIVTPEGVSRLARDVLPQEATDTPEQGVVSAAKNKQEQDTARKQQEVLQAQAGVTGEDIAAARESAPFESGRQGVGFMHLLPEEETQADEAPVVRRSTATTDAVLKKQVTQRLNQGLISERQAKQILETRAQGLKPFAAGTLLEQFTAENQARGATPPVDTSPTPLEQYAKDQEDYAQLQREEAAAREQRISQQLGAINENLAQAQTERTQGLRKSALIQAIESKAETVQRRSMEGGYDPYTDIENAFSNELKKSGIANTKPTEEEQGYIAGAVRLALTKLPEAEQPTVIPRTIPSATEATQLKGMESVIPERKEQVSVEPTQPSFEGMGRRNVEPVAEPTIPEPEAQDFVLTKGFLDEIGIAEKDNFTSRVLGASLRKAITGKPLSDPDVQAALVDYTKNQNISDITRTNIEQLLGKLTPGQGELFVPQERPGRYFVSKESVEAQRMRAAEAQKPTKISKTDQYNVSRAVNALDELTAVAPGDIVAGENVPARVAVPAVKDAKEQLRKQWLTKVNNALAVVDAARRKTRFTPEPKLPAEEATTTETTKRAPLTDLQSMLSSAKEAASKSDLEETKVQLEALKDAMSGASWETLFDVNPDFESAKTGRQARLSDYTGEQVQTLENVETAKTAAPAERTSVSPVYTAPASGKEFREVFETKQPWLNRKRALAYAADALGRKDITQDQHDSITNGIKNGANPSLQAQAVAKYAALNRGALERAQQRQKEAQAGAPYKTTGVVSFRRSYVQAVGMLADDVVNIVGGLTKDWKSDLNIEVVQSVDNLPKNLAVQAAAMGVDGVKGLAVRDGNTVFIIANNMDNEADVAATLFHEALGHAGLARAFGAQLDNILRAVYSTNAMYKQKADAWLAANEDAYVDEKNRELRALEEVLAEESELGRVNPSILAKIKAAIKDFARRLGLNLGYSNADVAAVLSAAHNVVIKSRERRAPALQETDSKVAFKIEKATEVQEKLSRSRNAEKKAQAGPQLADMFRDFSKSKGFLTDNWRSLDIPATRGLLAMAATADIRGIYGSRLPSIAKLDRVEVEHNLARGKMQGELENFIKTVWQPFVSANPVAGDVLADLLRASAMVQYDPRKPKAKLTDAEKFVQGLYETLGKTAGGHALYGRIIDSGKADLSKEVDALFAAVKNEDLPGDIKDPSTPKGALYEWVKGLRDKVATLEVYFPESRFGPYTVAIGSEEDGNLEVYMRDSRRERDRLRLALEEELRAKKDPRANTVRMYDTPKEARDNISGDSAKELKKIHAALGGKEVGPSSIETIKDAAFQLYMRTLPQTAALKDLEQRRKNITGASVDVIRGYAAHKYSANNRLARMVYGPQLRNATAEIKQEADKVSDAQEKLRLNTVAGELNARVNRALDPRFTDDEFQNSLDKLARLGSKGVFYSFLSSPKQFVVQFATLPMVAAPVFAGRYNTSINSMLTHMGQHLRLDRKELSLFNKDYSATRIKNPEAAKAFVKVYDELNASGFFDETRIAEAAAIAKKPQIGGTASEKALRNTGRALRFAFQTAESSVRKVIFATAFEFEYAKAKKEGKSGQGALDAARINAVEATYKTAFNYSIWNRSRLFTSNPIARTATQFMIFPMAMSSLLVESFNRYALSPMSTVEEKRAAAKQFWGIMGMTAVFGGLTGLPMYAVITAVLDGFAEYLGDDDDEDESNPLFRKNSDLWIKEWLIPNLFGSGSGLANTLGLSKEMGALLDRSLKYGPVSALTGLNIASSTSADNLPFMFFIDKDVSNKELEAGFYDTMLGPTGALIKNYINGVKDMAKGDYIRGVEQFLPSALKAPTTALRYASEGNVSRSGREVRGAEYYTASRLFLQSLGFTDTATFEKEDTLYQAVKTGYKIKEEKNALYDKLDTAFRKGNKEELQKIIKEDIINGFNKRYPTLRISADDITSSIEGRARERAQAKPSAGLNIGPRGFDRWEREIMGKYAE